jgi:hypothetical protein
MKRPNIATVTIQWIDENGEEHGHKFSEQTLEDAHTILGLMIGEITEADLEP